MRNRFRAVVPLVGLALLTLGADCPSLPDDYVAPWPQDTAEPGPYDESGAVGPLRLKAEGHDAWHRQWHQPYYGGRVAVRFTDTSHTQVEQYIGFGDSTFFSGIYLASQAMRYHVTGDLAAKENAIKLANARIFELARSEPEPEGHNVGRECARTAVEMVRLLAVVGP